MVQSIVNYVLLVNISVPISTLPANMEAISFSKSSTSSHGCSMENMLIVISEKQNKIQFCTQYQLNTI